MATRYEYLSVEDGISTEKVFAYTSVWGGVTGFLFLFGGAIYESNFLLHIPQSLYAFFATLVVLIFAIVQNRSENILLALFLHIPTTILLVIGTTTHALSIHVFQYVISCGFGFVETCMTLFVTFFLLACIIALLLLIPIVVSFLCIVVTSDAIENAEHSISRSIVFVLICYLAHGTLYGIIFF